MINLVADLKICQEAQGIVIESKFWWWMYEEPKLKNFDNHKDGGVTKTISAPLTDEILKVLPWMITIEAIPFYLTIQKHEDFLRVGYADIDGMIGYYLIDDKKLSNALLLLAIKLDKEGLLK